MLPSETGEPVATPTGRAHTENLTERRKMGGRIRAARLNAALTQRDLAKKLSVSAGAVGQWETGGSPATDRLATLAELLGVSVDWLLGKSNHVNARAGKDQNIEEDLRLLQEARHLGINLRTVVAEARQQRWIQDNRGALADANAFLARHGLWSDGKRQF